MKVFLDDVREAPPGWHRTYTVSETLRVLANEPVEALSLDHDLGEGHLEGYEVLRVMEQWVNLDGWEPPDEITIHSANPPARDRMQAAVVAIYRAWDRVKPSDAS